MTSAGEMRSLACLIEPYAEPAGRIGDFERAAAALRDAARMREALESLVAALVKCEPEIAGAFHIRQIHTNAYYTGPSYGEELAAARRILGGEPHE